MRLDHRGDYIEGTWYSFSLYLIFGIPITVIAAASLLLVNAASEVGAWIYKKGINDYQSPPEA